MNGNKYYLLNDKNKRAEEYVAYSDIAAEHGFTRGQIAGKFYRARKEGKMIIEINGKRFEQVKE